jgi:hypothetical protein
MLAGQHQMEYSVKPVGTYLKPRLKNKITTFYIPSTKAMFTVHWPRFQIGFNEEKTQVENLDQNI